MDIDLFRRLCATPGIPGREERVRALIAKETKGLFDSCTTDAMGSYICTRKPTRKAAGKTAGKSTGKSTGTPASTKPVRVMLAAHMDEIGFFVRHIDENGMIWVNPAGGFDARNLFASRVLVCTANGDFKGVMNPGGKPVHIASEAERTGSSRCNCGLLVCACCAMATQPATVSASRMPASSVGASVLERLSCAASWPQMMKVTGASSTCCWR